MLLQRKAFTLVELIVVITILAILGTIAFISLQGYSANARDSVRLSDLASIKKSLELFQLKTAKYPQATSPVDITFSGSLAWSQGIFGVDSFQKSGNLDKLPLDPLTQAHYVYSVTNTRKEFQLAAIFEGDYAGGKNIGISQVVAGDKIATLKITGNYNGKILKVNQSTLTYILAVPSIITSSGGILQEIVGNGYLSYSGYKNLPLQYNDSAYNPLADEGMQFVQPANLVVYSGSLSDLTKNSSDRATLIQNLKSAYLGTQISNANEMKELSSIDLSNASAVDELGVALINNYLGGKISIGIKAEEDQTPVSTLQTCTYSDGADSPYLCAEANGSGRFEFTVGSSAGGTSVVLDKLTGLNWQSEGVTQGIKTWLDAKTYCANLDLGGQSDWRMPDYTELTSILDYSRINPSIDIVYFTSKNGYYWTSITINAFITFANVIEFGFGDTYGVPKVNSINIRCVR